MPNIYRLFLALDLPDSVKGSLAARVAEERDRLPPARWVRMAGAHLTLVFLGETTVDLLPPLGRALEEVAAGCRPFTLQVKGAGTFPPERPARVAWLGFSGGEGDLEALAILQRRVRRAACRAVGIEEEKRPFRPHLTVARMRSPWPRGAVATFVSAFQGPFGDSFAVDRAFLLRSHLLPGGPRYETMGEFPLGDAVHEEKGAG